MNITLYQMIPELDDNRLLFEPLNAIKKENQSITTACVILLVVIFLGIISFVIKKRHFILAVFRHPYAVRVSRLLSKYSDFKGNAKKQVLYLCNYYEKDYKQYIKMNPYIAIIQLIEFSGIKGNEKEKYIGVKDFYVKPKEPKSNKKVLVILVVAVILVFGILIGFMIGTITSTHKSSNVTSHNNDYVYIGKSGNKYHKENCVSLKSKGEKIKLQDDEEKGKEPCKICIADN